MNLPEWLTLVQSMATECRWCGGRLADHIDNYDHDEGWTVEGFARKQWLSVRCLNCGYNWSIWKLGVPREAA